MQRGQAESTPTAGSFLKRWQGSAGSTPTSQLLALGSELYGRWCTDAVELLRELVALKAREAPPALRGRAAHTWANRWWSIVTVGTQRAVAESLIRHGGVDLQATPGPEDTPPLADLVADF